MGSAGVLLVSWSDVQHPLHHALPAGCPLPRDRYRKTIPLRGNVVEHFLGLLFFRKACFQAYVL
jgi:hypothetical protein